MFNSTVLEVAVGLIFTYLLLALVCSAVNEWIAGLFALRSRTLASGIKNLLQDSGGIGLAKDLYSHGLILGLSKNTTDKNGRASPAELTGNINGKDGPAYLPAATFALALLDKLDLLLPLDPAKDAAGRNVAFEAALTEKKVPDSVRDALRAIYAQANGDVATFQAGVEKWFDDSMERVSGWYKRWTQVILFGLGLLLTIALNADTLHVAQALSHDDALRASVYAQAQKVGSGAMPKPADAYEQLEAVPLPIGWVAGDRTPPLDPARLLGWFITAAALSLGAPFWFDALNKVMNIRSGGNPPGEKPKK